MPTLTPGPEHCAGVDNLEAETTVREAGNQIVELGWNFETVQDEPRRLLGS
jgi:hypothetical protein